MDVDFFFPETVLLVPQDGGPHLELRAQITRSDELIVHGDQAVITIGDAIKHTYSNGAVNQYAVLDVRYQRGTRDLPATTTLKVSKKGVISKAGTNEHHTYHVSGDNARINIRSNDFSTNTVTTSSVSVFKDLSIAISALPEGHPQKRQLLQAVADLSATPPKTPVFTEKFKEFVQLAANCITIVAPFLPAITQMLGN